jgi:DNA-binding transcriptional MerR regulator
MTTALSIQQVAAVTGLSVHTLRYYERIGLIDPVPRAGNKHRQYRAEDIRWIKFLLRLRSTGLPIQQMLRYAELRRLGNQFGSVSERKALLARHAQTLEAELASLQETLGILHAKVALYSGMEKALQADAKQPTGKGMDHGKQNIRKRFKKTCGS